MIIKQIYLLYIKKSTALDEQCDFSDGWSDLCDRHKDYFLTKMY